MESTPEPSTNRALLKSEHKNLAATQRSAGSLKPLNGRRNPELPFRKRRIAWPVTLYFALGAAILTFIITHNVRSTISVVIVAGACGIAAGTPLAILGAIGRAAHQGAIIKGGLYLEALAAVDTVLLDKTGTLTFGTPQIQEVVSANGFQEQQIIAAASIAERKSEHPLAKAVLARATELAIPLVDPDQFSYTPGRGVRVIYRGRGNPCR